MVALGGFVNGGAVILWSLLSPLGVMTFAGRRQAVGWLLGFLALLVVSSALEPFAPSGNNLPAVVTIAFFAMNIGAVSILAFVLLQYFIKQLEQERKKSDRLLLNVLPREVAAILKEGDRTIADYFEEVSILFADIVGSTALAVRVTPTELVDILNEAFSYFDTLVEKYDLEKIRTIGDNYMVASGVPRPRRDHAKALAQMALEMNRYSDIRSASGQTPLQFRMGMNSGPVVAGVIGFKKFHYDIWGDAVNTASHMESHGAPGKIQITRATYKLIEEDFVCKPRGLIEVKGKGKMETWFLEDIRASASSVA
jgi:guanylate cyclase